MTKSARGMPSVELSQNTKDAIEAEETKAEEMKREDPFVKPNLEIKTTETLAPIAEVEEPRVVKKPKKKLTEKQLEALKRGRVKSAETRKKKAEEKRKANEEKNAPKNHIQTAEAMRPPPVMINAPQIDYDRIINGVSNLWGQQQQQKQEVEFNVAEFEKKVREDEKNKVYADLDKIQQEEEQAQAQAVAKNHLQRQPQSLNPYAYAFNLNSRSRYQRY